MEASGWMKIFSTGSTYIHQIQLPENMDAIHPSLVIGMGEKISWNLITSLAKVAWWTSWWASMWLIFVDWDTWLIPAM